MKKNDIYELRTLFWKIDSDFKNDVGMHEDGSVICRATLIQDSVKKGLKICNDYIEKMKPIF